MNVYGFIMQGVFGEIAMCFLIQGLSRQSALEHDMKQERVLATTNATDSLVRGFPSVSMGGSHIFSGPLALRARGFS